MQLNIDFNKNSSGVVTIARVSDIIQFTEENPKITKCALNLFNNVNCVFYNGCDLKYSHILGENDGNTLVLVSSKDNSILFEKTINLPYLYGRY